MNKHQTLKLIANALHALEVVGDLAKAHLGSDGPAAVSALHAIAKIADSVEQGFAGDLSNSELEETVLKAQDLLDKTIAANDAARDAAADAKYGPEK